MSWRKDQGRAERGYHHGNLKEALLQAALDLISKKGPAGFTFADAARMAGVSPAAPYRHFRDRDELIASIAQRGFAATEFAAPERAARSRSRLLTLRAGAGALFVAAKCRCGSAPRAIRERQW